MPNFSNASAISSPKLSPFLSTQELTGRFFSEAWLLLKLVKIAKGIKAVLSIAAREQPSSTPLMSSNIAEAMTMSGLILTLNSKASKERWQVVTR